MSTQQPKDLIVFSDLDGTLLGHRDYRYECNLPLIRRLESAGIPLILATSKTEAEVGIWQERLGLAGPFMVENGAMVRFPKASYTDADMPTASFTHSKDYLDVALGTPLPKLEHFLRTFVAETGCEFTSFVHCSIEEAMQLTGLPREDAARAQQRSWSLPLVPHESADIDQFMLAAAREGLRAIRGGRFLHLQGMCDKRDAMLLIVRAESARRGINLVTVALGDNQNDAAMLTAADQPIVMKTESGYQVSIDNNNVIHTRNRAPEGWQEGLGIALEKYGKRDLTHG